jgi:1-acyl-sn-glycerol-3-phosphate acyltransferase
VNILLSPWFIADLIFGIACIEYALYKSKPLIKINEERDSKYSAFRRYDTKYLTRQRLYLAAPFVFIRFGLAMSLVAFAYILTRLINFNVMSGEKPSTRQIEWSKRLHMICTHILCAISGVYYFTYTKVDTDYKQYLGPDWKPTDRKPSTIVANHSVWLDIPMLWKIKNCPIFVAK